MNDTININIFTIMENFFKHAVLNIIKIFFFHQYFFRAITKCAASPFRDYLSSFGLVHVTSYIYARYDTIRTSSSSVIKRFIQEKSLHHAWYGYFRVGFVCVRLKSNKSIYRKVTAWMHKKIDFGPNMSYKSYCVSAAVSSFPRSVATFTA